VNDEAKRALQNKELMDYLYHVKGMSITQIARLHGCSYTTVRNGLIRLGIELRSPGAKQGQGVLIPDLKPSPELVHLVFALKGDGSVGRYNGCGQIRFYSIDKVLAESVRNDLIKVGLHPNVTGPHVNHEHSKNTKPIYKLDAYSKLFTQHYLSLTTQDLLGLGLTHPFDALRGFLETEGSVYYSRYSLRVIIISNTDLDLIQVARELLTSLGYRSSIHKSSNPILCYQLYLQGTTKEKEQFLNQLKPCVKWPIKAKRV